MDEYIGIWKAIRGITGKQDKFDIKTGEEFNVDSELNDKIVLRSDFKIKVIPDNSNIDVIHMISGG